MTRHPQNDITKSFRHSIGPIDHGKGGYMAKTCVKFDPKSQNYFGKIQGAYKHGYNKDELRDNFEKVVNTDFENPYKKGLKVVDKSNFL